MDLKNGMKILKENITLRRILEVLLGVGNYLNGVEVQNLIQEKKISLSRILISFYICF